MDKLQTASGSLAVCLIATLVLVSQSCQGTPIDYQLAPPAYRGVSYVAAQAPPPQQQQQQLVAPISTMGHLQQQHQQQQPQQQRRSISPLAAAIAAPQAWLIDSNQDRFKRQSAAAAAAAGAGAAQTVPGVPIVANASSTNVNNSSNSNKKKKKNANKKNKNKNKSKFLLSDCLIAHNKFRRQHKVPDLEWDDKLAEFAQKRSNHIAASDGAAFGHPPDLPFGENLFWHSSVETACEHMIRGWYDEISLYNYRAPTFAPETGHFTQLIWRSTSRVGCAFATSSGKRGGIYLTCNYDPPGNFVGEFNENVPLPAPQLQPSEQSNEPNGSVKPTTQRPIATVTTPTPTTTTTTTTTTTLTAFVTQAPTTTTTAATLPALVTDVGLRAGDKPAASTTTVKPKPKPKKKKGKKKKNKNKKKKNKKASTTTTTTTPTPAPISTNASTTS